MARLYRNSHKVAATQFERKLKEFESQKIDFEQKIDEIKAQIIDPSKMQMSLEEFLNLANSASNKMEAGTSVQRMYYVECCS